MESDRSCVCTVFITDNIADALLMTTNALSPGYFSLIASAPVAADTTIVMIPPPGVTIVGGNTTVIKAGCVCSSLDLVADLPV